MNGAVERLAASRVSGLDGEIFLERHARLEPLIGAVCRGRNGATALRPPLGFLLLSAGSCLTLIAGSEVHRKHAPGTRPM